MSWIATQKKRAFKAFDKSFFHLMCCDASCNLVNHVIKLN